ncbi:Uncharacterised protein [Bordetella ansorpii]|uniref:Uncharacterized protein n=1 Tax=Bordetella ansorpii TaxID=288768 RepID=A0A157S5F3_9BORD|nr:hypothetical protein [Bordetella ansorpii]SAI65493.1 Uncharacterised protein [Bordetella ansorpii]
MHQQIAIGVFCLLLALIALMVGRLVYWHWVKKAPREVRHVEGEAIEPDRDAIPPAYSALAILVLFAVLVGVFIVLTD